MAKVALLIGVSRYGTGFQALPETPKDVEAVKQVLEHPERGGFDQVKVVLDPDPIAMQESIEVMFAQCQPDDLILLFFSGHGVKDSQGAFYLGTSITRKTEQGQLVRSTAVPVRTIHEFINSSPARRQIAIIDCCFSGAFAQGLMLGRGESPDRGGRRERIILTSSNASQYSLTSMQSSYKHLNLDLSTFTTYLVEGVETGLADQNGDGQLTIAELYEYARKRVQIAAPAMRPEIHGSESLRHLPLIRSPQPATELLYCKTLESWIQQGEISAIGRSALAIQRQALQLSVEMASSLELMMLKPYREYKQRLHRYRQFLLEAIQREYLITEENQPRLEKLRQMLGLTEESVAQLALQSEEYGRCLQRYEQALREVLHHQYPPTHYTYEELQRLQKVLGLTDRDVSLIKNRMEGYKQRLEQYEKSLVEAMQQEFPLSETSRQQLMNLQQLLELEDEDIAPITVRVEAYQRRLQQYQQEVTESIRWQPLNGNGIDHLPLWQSILDLDTDPPSPAQPPPPAVPSSPISAPPPSGVPDPAPVSEPPFRQPLIPKDPPTSSPATVIQSGPVYPPSSPPVVPPPPPIRSPDPSSPADASAPPVNEGRQPLENIQLKPSNNAAGLAPPIGDRNSEGPNLSIGAAALVGILLGVMLGGLVSLLVLNLLPTTTPPPAPVPTGSPQ